MDIFNQIIERNQGILITLAEIVVYTVLISLIVYHLIIFFGRRSFPEGKVYLYFSMLLTGFMSYIFLDSNLYYFTFSQFLSTDAWTTFFTGLCWAFIFLSVRLLLQQFIQLNPQTSHLLKTGFKVYLLLLVLWIIPVLPAFLHLHSLVFNVFWIVTGVFILFQFIIYARCLREKHHKLDEEIKIISWGVLLYIVYMWVYRIALINNLFDTQLPLWILNNLLKIGLSFTFAYALARKFNREFTDLTILKENLERKVEENTRELRLANEKIEAESRLRNNYFIQVAHETKTPLTLIGNYFNRFKKLYGDSDEIKIMEENLHLLRETMVRFLDAEKLKKGEIVYQHQQVVDLSHAIQIKCPLFHDLALQNNRVLICNVEAGIHVEADPLAIERILHNLFDNALKFTRESDTIQITLTSYEDMATLVVSDTGIGMDKQTANHIFEQFYRAADSFSCKQGMGMGLYIVKQTVASLKGKIEVSTVPNRGSSFTVFLPRCRKGVDAASIAPSPETVRVFSSATIAEDYYKEDCNNILVIEDHPDMLRYLTQELSGTYNIFLADNGAKALDLLKSSPRQDLILSDVMMPGMDGYEFYDLVTRIPEYATIPFIFVTARSNRDERIDLLNRGVTDYIFKPFQIDELKAKIQSALMNSRMQRHAGLKDAIEAIHDRLVVPAGNSGPDKWKTFELRIRTYNLTERQVEVIREVEKGYDYNEIANRLHLSPKTVHRHIQILFEKVQVHTKMDLLKRLFE